MGQVEGDRISLLVVVEVLETGSLAYAEGPIPSEQPCDIRKDNEGVPLPMDTFARFGSLIRPVHTSRVSDVRELPDCKHIFSLDWHGLVSFPDSLT